MALSNFIIEKISCFDILKNENRPIFIYGMGDGAIKIINEMRRRQIPVAGFFASDEFVRGHSFEGYRVHKLSEIEAQVDDFVIVLAFAVGYPELYQKILSISKKHTLYAPDVPVVGTEIFDYDYYLKNYKKLQSFFEILSDEKSRMVLADIINYKISGKIDYLTHAESEKGEIYQSLLKVDKTEKYVDLGAYNGDTVKELLFYTEGSFSKIYAVEPDAKNYRKLSSYLDTLNRDADIKKYPCAAWSEKTILEFSARAGRHSSLKKGGNEIEALSADYILDGKSATLIKMDVEGAEYQAILGCRNTIRQFNPRMIVSVYHRSEDIFALPLLLYEINPCCSMYLRHMSYIPAWDTLLITKPK